jgi:hypothetical protein
VASLRDPGGVYVRRFQRGLVAVNPDSSSHVLSLSAPGRVVEPQGGGALDAGADTSGWALSERPVSGSLELPAHAGAVVLTGS